MEEIKKKKRKKKKTSSFTLHNVLTVLGITITVMLIPILMINMVLIVKGTANNNQPPSIFGVTPLVVLSGSMDDGSYGAIAIGDLIFVKEVDAENLKENEIVAFMEDGYAVTHRIVAVNEVDGKVTYTTRGDANNTDDSIPLEPDNVIGQYFYRIPSVGNFILYMQTTQGIILFIGVPLILFAVYDVIRRRIFTKSELAKQEQLKKELEELKRRPSQANSYKPVQGQVLKQPNTSPAPTKPAVETAQAQASSQSMPQTTPITPPVVTPPEVPPTIPPAVPPRREANVPPPVPKKQDTIPAEPVKQEEAPMPPVEEAPTVSEKAKPVVKKTTVQIKKVTKSKK